jgi:hypothetical protein
MARTARQPSTSLGDLAELARDALDARGTLAPDAAVELLLPLPDLLDAARVDAPHPAPPKLGPEARALLSALGVVRPPRGVVDGPAPFHAPELAPGATPTPHTDAYAVAGLLRTAITGDTPPPWTLDALPPADGARKLQGGLDELLWAALADDPGQRPADVAALLRLAEDAARQPAAPAGPRREPARERELPERKVLLLGGATGVAFLIGLMLAVSGGTEDPVAPRPVAALQGVPERATGQLAYATGMRRAMRGLNTRRVARREQLAAAGTTAAQTRAATGLGEAYRIAARSVDKTPTPPQARESTAGIIRLLQETEDAYRVMARGARDEDRAEFNRGREAVQRREAALQRRLERLERLGYDVI